MTISRVINDVAVINELLSQGLITLIGDILLLVGIVDRHALHEPAAGPAHL